MIDFTHIILINILIELNIIIESNLTLKIKLILNYKKIHLWRFTNLEGKGRKRKIVKVYLILDDLSNLNF